MLARNRSIRSSRRLDISSGLPTNAPIHPTEINPQPILYPCTPSEPRGAESLYKASSACRFEHAQTSLPKYNPHPLPLYDDHQYSEMMIGVALGSPGHGPLPPSLTGGGASRTDKYPEPLQKSHQLIEQDALRPRGNRWKPTIGGLFGKRSGMSQTPPALARYQICEPGPSAQTYRSHHQPPKYQVSSPHAKPQDSTVGVKQQALSRHWIGPDQLRPPQDRKNQVFYRKTSFRRKNILRKEAMIGQKAVDTERDRPEGCTVGSTASPVGAMTHKDVPPAEPQVGSLLQVQIPNVELERYSVMFSALLHSGEQSYASRQPSPKRQPSLLARRQGNLRTVQTAQVSNSACPEIRAEDIPGNRAALPSESRSFSLFPLTPNASRGRSQSSRRERSPLQPSATTPGYDSPSKAKFDFFDSHEEQDQDQDQVVVIVRSPEEQREPQDRRTNGDFFSHVLPRTTTSSENTFTTTCTSPDTGPQRPGNARKPTGVSLRKAAEVPIPRQTSASERQRQLLVAPQPVQPRIINVQRQGSKSRKSRHSHHLVLDNA